MTLYNNNNNNMHWVCFYTKLRRRINEARESIRRRRSVYISPDSQIAADACTTHV